MKHKIVLVPFPFDDLTANKVRPAVCLTDEIKPHSHIVLAFIPSTGTIRAFPEREKEMTEQTEITEQTEPE